MLMTHALRGYSVHAVDGDLGVVDSFLFDDRTWTIRYIVVELGNWLVERKVLLSPSALSQIKTDEKQFHVNLTQDQVRQSPNIDTDMPVSRQHEVQLLGYYGWPAYWDDWAGAPLFVEPVPVQNSLPGDPHLRSTEELTGYVIHSSDGEIGHLSDFHLDEATWKLHHLIVSTRNWLPGKKVELPVEWVLGASWENSEVLIDHSRADVFNCPNADVATD